MRLLVYVLLIAMTGSAATCERPETRADKPVSGVVDSVLTREEALRRFREGLPPVTELAGGQKSRDTLVVSFLRALKAQDTLALASMAVTRAEFAYLYYPTTPQGFPPYDVEPGLMWHLLLERSNRGLRRSLAAYGGSELRLLSYDCGKEMSREGDNTVVGPCILQVRDKQGKTTSLRLFSQILERNGRYKFLSYANKL